ncbi:hypothetical protein C0993_000589, partial [Termitomyces sp. T159_Od127]
QIKVDALFAGYRIQSNADNEITMAINSEALLAALKSASSSSTSAYETEEVIVKLAKKNAQAVLTFEINSLTRVGRKVHILLPPLQKLRTVVDRMKVMSDILAVRANNRGVLRLSINTETVKVDTEWKGCTNPR